MSIKGRVLLLALIVLGAVLVLAASSFLTIRSTSSYTQRVELAYQQLVAVTALKADANRYSEQIAEFLLVGDAQRPDYESARADLETGFDTLERITRREAKFVEGSGDPVDWGDELYRISRMRQLYDEIIKATSIAIDLRNQGRREDAIRVFYQEIEDRFDAEFESLLEAARLDELDEVRFAETQAANLTRRLSWATATIALVVVVVCAAVSFVFIRSLLGPIGLLTQGADAIGRGELDHRIDYERNDELGKLARRFNAMATNQEMQHRQLSETRAALEQQVKVRTQELAAANHRLTDLDRRRVQFLADISHELRTPLTALRGEAEIPLRHGSKSEAIYRDALNRIVSQCLEMSRLVDELMFLSRAETGTIRFEPVRIDFMAVVAELVHEGEILGRSKNIKIKVNEGTAPIWVNADPQQLKQALVIILDNAIKYSPQGRSVTLRTRVDGKYAEIAIRDEGMGIPAEDIPNVFDRFYRGANAKASREPGRGLGLAIAKSLIEKHLGKITITSTVGTFTEIVVRIACADFNVHSDKKPGDINTTSKERYA